jgi:hypothetical protein
MPGVPARRKIDMAKAEARVLLDHDGFKINQVVSGADAERGVAEGWADGDPAAVKYAKGLAKEAPAAAEEEVHEAPAE